MTAVSLLPGLWWKCPSCGNRNLVEPKYSLFIGEGDETPYTGFSVPEGVTCDFCGGGFESSVGDVELDDVST